MAAKLLDLVANVFFHDVKGKESTGRGHCVGAGSRYNQSAQLLFATAQQSAIGVVNDHDLFRSEQVVRDDQRSNDILGHDATRVSQDMSVACVQSQCLLFQPGVHAGDNGQMTLRARRDVSQFVLPCVEFVRCEDFVDHAHWSHHSRSEASHSGSQALTRDESCVARRKEARSSRDSLVILLGL